MNNKERYPKDNTVEWENEITVENKVYCGN